DLGDETTISTDLSLSSFSGTGTGDWEPLIQYSDILNASGDDSDTIQLTLIY
ncbi:MAG: hypothetical protein IID17_14735, partial [Nitrospinae bacterium]|nr:hypothetical protein [Nitrospinota bacterium]